MITGKFSHDNVTPNNVTRRTLTMSESNVTLSGGKRSGRGEAPVIDRRSDKTTYTSLGHRRRGIDQWTSNTTNVRQQSSGGS